MVDVKINTCLHKKSTEIQCFVNEKNGKHIFKNFEFFPVSKRCLKRKYLNDFWPRNLTMKTNKSQFFDSLLSFWGKVIKISFDNLDSYESVY